MIFCPVHYPSNQQSETVFRFCIRLYHTVSSTCTEVSGIENIGQCGRLSQLSWLLGAL